MKGFVLLQRQLRPKVQLSSRKSAALVLGPNFMPLSTRLLCSTCSDSKVSFPCSSVTCSVAFR